MIEEASETTKSCCPTITRKPPWQGSQPPIDPPKPPQHPAQRLTCTRRAPGTVSATVIEEASETTKSCCPTITSVGLLMPPRPSKMLLAAGLDSEK